MRTTTTIALASILLLAGCGSTTQSEYPIGLGTGPNSLKKSPCACLELPNAATRPGWSPVPA